MIVYSSLSIGRAFTRCAAMSVWASHTVYAADAPLFAAPVTGHATGSSGGGSFSQVTLALAVVLAFVFLAAWALRHLRKLNIAGGAQQLQIVAQVALGSKERAVLVRVNDVHVLVGVAPGRVTALHSFVAPSAASPQINVPPEQTQVTAAPVSFQSLLKKSLGLS
jgi:flagellar protein FliO/FliZ